jgi:hypothetical protein
LTRWVGGVSVCHDIFSLSHYHVDVKQVITFFFRVVLPLRMDSFDAALHKSPPVEIASK